jgi:GntR family histidine utilization transcriptional repressor
MTADLPLYRQIKRHIRERIQSGEWPAEHLVPSENTLVKEFGASRMTVNRALRELVDEGLVVRVQGLGTFVNTRKAESEPLEIRNIAAEIAERGHVHAADVHALDQLACDESIALHLQLPVGAPAYHSLIVHRENGEPVQWENRFVNPGLAPDYLTQDFTHTTPNQYLMQAVRPDTVQHNIEAVAATADQARLLDLEPGAPCLLLERRTFSNGDVVTWAQLVFPGARYRLSSTFTFRD